MADVSPAPLAPGSVIGILGGGQLGRMLAMAARRLGYGVQVYEPEPDCPAAAVADSQTCAAWDDLAALDAFAARCDVVTFEFENVPVDAARRLEATVPVRPSPLALEKSQDRVTEKAFLNALGIATAPWADVPDADALEAALAGFGGRGLLKTRRMGYDGKGQMLIDSAEARVAGNALLLRQPCILEGLVAFDCEISVVAARGADGAVACFDAARNVHRGGILRSSTVPAGVPAELVSAAESVAARVLDALGYVGVIGVEFFFDGDRLLVNEIAPRVHNSGHWTEAACLVSQFEQHIRAVCGLPLGSPHRHSDCVMENLIGADMERVPALLAQGDVLVHLYGKRETREGRKMGHFTRLSVRTER